MNFFAPLGGEITRPGTWRGVPVKDREAFIDLEDDDVRIVYLRSSARPVEYAILLQKAEPESWKTVMVADNSHKEGHREEGICEHHCHRYIADEKQPAESLPFSVTSTNDAMAKVIQWFEAEWKELIS